MQAKEGEGAHLGLNGGEDFPSLQEWSGIQEVVRIITSTSDIDEVYNKFAVQVRKLVEADRININVIDREASVSSNEYHFGKNVAEFPTGFTLPLEGSTTGHVASTGRTLVYGEAEEASQFVTSPALAAAGLRSNISVPLISNGCVIAVLHLMHSSGDAFGPREQATLERLAYQIAPAIDNARLYRDVQKAEYEARLHHSELEALIRISRILIEPGSFKVKAKAALDELSRVASADWVCLLVADDTERCLRLAASTGPELRLSPSDNLTPYGVGIIGAAFATGEPVVANKYHKHPAAVESRATASQEAAMAIPLSTPEGPVGVLFIGSRTVDHFTPDLVKILAAIGESVGGLLEQAGLYQRPQATTVEMTVAEEVARIITSALDIDQVYEGFAAEVKKLVDFDRTSINLLDSTGSALEIAYLNGGDDQNYPKGVDVHLSETHSAWVVENQESFILEDLTKDTKYKTSAGLIADGLRSMITVPLMSNGQALGTFSLASNRINAYGQPEQVTLERLAGQIAPAIENSRLIQEAKEQALVLASIADAVLFSNQEGTVRFINRAFEEMFGYNSDEVLGRNAGMFIPPDPASQKQRFEINNAALRAPWKGEVKRLRKNGEQFDADLSLNPVKDREENVLGFIVIFRDITEPKRAEEALRQSEAEAKRLAGENAMLAEIGRIVSSSLDVDEVYDRFTQEVRKHIPFDRIAIVTPDPGNKTGIIAHIVSDVNVMHRQAGNAIILPGGIVDEVISTQKELLVNLDDVEQAVERFPLIRPHWDAGLRSFMATPLISRDQVIGVLQIQSKRVNAYSERDLRLVNSIGAQIAGAVANSQLFAEGLQKEKALMESEESNRQMALFAHLNPAPVLRFDTMGEVLLANAAAIDVLGGDEKGYAPLSSVLPGVAALDLKQLIEQGEVISHVAQLGEKYFQLVLRGVPELGMGQLYGTDISDRMSLEEQLRKISQAVEQSPFGVAITDLEGKIEYANARLTQITGHSTEELLGSPTSIWASRVTTEEEHSRIWDTIRGGEAWRGELLNRRKDGEPYWVLESISPVKNPSGGITHFVDIQEDVTERKFLEEQLTQSQKMDSMGQLASGVAHDFNNLLTAIVGYARLGSASLPDENPVADYLLAISQAAERAAELTNQLLVFSRRQPVAAKVLDLNHLIIDFDRMLRRLLGVNIELVVLLAPDLKKIKADPTQMDQVLLNLAVNAKDAMPQGGKLIIETSNVNLSPSLASQLADVSPGEYVMLSVTDNGEGIPDEVMSRIFEPFFTTKAIGKGTGLGLATCYGFVKQNGGYIQVESEPSQGSAFRIYLPKTDAEASHTDGIENENPVVKGTETVLLAEDEPLVLTMVSRTLRDHGYRVLESTNGEEALRVAEEHGLENIDVLVTDIVMPRMGGLELAERIRTMRKDLKIVFTSGYTDKTVLTQGEDPPGVAFLSKPFLPDELAAKVRGVLD